MASSDVSQPIESVSSSLPPFHVLMAPPATEQEQQIALAKRRLFDPRLQRDYLAKRHKAYHRHPSMEDEKLSENKNEDGYRDKPADDGKKDQKTRPIPSIQSLSLWDGTSKVERELVSCCELFNDNDDGQDNDDMEGLSGTLDRKHEVKFVATMARACHTLSSRALAIAILERTIEAYLYENDPGNETKDDESDENDGDSSSSDDENEEAEQLKQMATDEEWKPGSLGIRRSLRNRNKFGQPATKSYRNKNSPQQPQPKKRKKIVKQEEEEEEVVAADNNSVERLDAFLVSGGLKILNRWLIEASVPSSSPPSTSASKTATSKSASAGKNLKRPPMRPLVIPILRVLQYIPFNKKLVMESKINKQIKRLGKQVDALLDARSKGRHREEDVDGWIIVDDDDDSDPLLFVKETVSTVKRTWEESVATKQVEITIDPFEEIKSKMRERLDSLMAYEAGTIDRPEWFVLPEKEKKKESKKKLKAAKKLNAIQQLAAKERQAEREELQKRLKNAVNESRERLTKLREQMRKRREENLTSSSSDSKPAKLNIGKRVTWKDGSTHRHYFDRKLLEEVFIIPHRNDKDGANDLNGSVAANTAAPNKESDHATKSEDDVVTSSSTDVNSIGSSNPRVAIDPSNALDDPNLL